MSFIQRLISAWKAFQQRPQPSPSYDLWADTEDFWTEADSAWLKASLQSDSGVKLNAILQNYVFRSAQQATGMVRDLNFHCGHARGVASTVSFIQSHLPKPPPQNVAPEEAVDPRHAAFLASIGA